MSTTWELLQQCLGDAAKAEDLFRNGTFRTELRRDPERALAVFSVRQPRRHRTMVASVARGPGRGARELATL